MSSNEDLKTAIVEFLDGYSIEVTPHDADKLDAMQAELPSGTAVYVAHLPGRSLDELVEVAGSVQARGLAAVPHIVARKLASEEQLDGALARLRELGVDQALVIAGDEAVPKNAFDSSLDVLRTGLFDQHGFAAVGVAGHPEGSAAIGDERAERALADKAAFAKSAKFEMRIVTQFGFDPEAFTSWESRLREAGITLPIHAGMAGPASVKQLVRYAMACGVGASARMLMKRTGATANLLKTQAPDNLITHFARHRAADPASTLKQAHFFAFGGVLKTARWANTVIAREFALNSRGTGFEV